MEKINLMMMHNRFYDIMTKIKAIKIGLILIFLSSCLSTKVNMEPSYGFKFREGDSSVGWITKNGEVGDYWTNRFNEYLADNQISIGDLINVQDIIYAHLLSHNLTDSLSLIKIGKLTGLDYLFMVLLREKAKK